MFGLFQIFAQGEFDASTGTSRLARMALADFRQLIFRMGWSRRARPLFSSGSQGTGSMSGVLRHFFCFFP
ncbi:MAG: hypothetical protein ABIH04_10935 [Planctomycetota bacterium]